MTLAHWFLYFMAAVVAVMAIDTVASFQAGGLDRDNPNAEVIQQIMGAAQ